MTFLCCAGTLASFWLPPPLARMCTFASYFLIGGYLLRYLRCVAQTGRYDLPSLFEAGQSVLPYGLVAFLIDFAYSLPALLLFELVARLTVNTWSSVFISLAFANQVADVWSPNLAGSMSNGLLVVVLSLTVLMGVVCAMFVPAAQLLFASSGQIGDALNIPSVLGYVRKNARDYALTLVGMLLIFAVCSRLGTSVVLWSFGHNPYYFYGHGFWHGMGELFVRTMANMSMFVASLLSAALWGRFYLKHPR